MSEGATENENPEALQSVQEEGEPENAATEADSASLEQTTDPVSEPVNEPAGEPVEPVEPVADEDDTVQADQTESDSAANVEADAPVETAADDGEGGTTELAATGGEELSEHVAGDDATTDEAADGEVAEASEDAAAVEGGVEGGEEKTESATDDAEVVQSSETFDEEGGPVIEIAEKLSHDGSPTGAADGDFPSEPMDHPDPRGTPPLASPTSGLMEAFAVGGDDLDPLEEDYSVDGDFPTYDRTALLEKYKESLEERQKIQQQNSQIQHKLAEYFRKKKTDDRGQEMEKNVTDQEQRYLKYMSNLEELQNEQDRLNENILIQTEDAKSRCEEKQLKVETASTEFMEFKYDVAKTAVNSRSGKAIPLKNVEQLQLNEDKKEQEVIAVRLENIKLKNRLKKREQQLKAKEELAEGLHLIDFEQLKIENQTYNEKIEERNEEILKLRRKITTTVQVLTHLKEKLQFVQGENGEQRSKLRDIDVTVAQRRDILTKMKQVRDALRTDNSKLKHKSGLLGNEPLLRDFELRKDEGDELRERLAHLKEDHIELNMNLNSLRMKIERAQKM